MFKKPEELIMAVLVLLWVVLAYFLSAYATGAAVKYVVLITGLNALWAAGAFWLWQKERWTFFWPLPAGLLVACWWPWLDWFALRGIIPTAGADGLIVVQKPWYASWAFKILLALLPTAGLYVLKWRNGRKRRMAGLV